MFELTPERITTDPVYRVLAILSIPLVVQNLVEVTQAIVDIFWVGRLGSDAVAAVGLVYPIHSLLLIATIITPFVGTQVLVSQRIGADDEAGARLVAFNGFALAAVLGVGMGVLAFLAAPTLIDLMTATQPRSVAADISGLAVRYFRIVALGLVVASMSDALEASYVARGDSRAAFYISLATVLTNVVGDPLLIFGIGPFPRLGIEGAALATVLGYATGLAVAVAFVLRGRAGGIITRAAMRVELSEHREIFDVGLPPAAQRISRRVVDTVTVVIVFAAGGAAGLAAYLIGMRLYAFATVPAFGLQQATQSVVGQNLGASQPDRANRTTWVGVVFISLVLVPIGAVQWVVPGPITTLLAPDLSTAAFDASVQFLRILAYSYLAFGVVNIVQGGLNGARRTEISFYSSVLQYWLLQLPLAAGVGLFFAESLVGVFWSVTVATIVTGVALAAYYYHLWRSGLFETAADEIERAAAG